MLRRVKRAALRRIFRYAILFRFLPGLLLAAAPLQPRQTSDNIVSEHVRFRLPVEREWIGRDTIADMERCWQFTDRALDGKLPRRVLIVVSWGQGRGWTRAAESTIFVGMDDPAAVSDPKAYLAHQAAREMARLGLLELSGGGAAREENQWLIEGMAEIMAREFRGRARAFDAAWVYSSLLDRMGRLSLESLGSWKAFSGGRRDFYAAAPGATFLLTCRQAHGREGLVKLFEALRKQDAAAAMSSAFRRPAAALEQIWLRKVRENEAARDVTVTSDADSPALVVPPATEVRPGAGLRIRLFIEDGGANLGARGVFLADLQSARVFSVRDETFEGRRVFVADLPQDSGAAAGKTSLRVTALDESGNVRHWEHQVAIAP
ncbi:MAG: hypothetical protein ABIG68_08510 [Acidobacteriota bacterium]